MRINMKGFEPRHSLFVPAQKEMLELQSSLWQKRNIM